MKARVSEPKSWQRLIDVEIPHEEFESAYAEKVNKYRREVRLPGFRPGKVTTGIIRSRFGDVIRAETVEELVQKSYEGACKDNSLTPVSQAKVSNIRSEEGKPLTFTIETEVDPPVEIKGYANLKIRPNPSKIKSGDIDKVIDDLRERMAEFRDVGRPSKKGDFVSLEYQKVVVDGAERTDVSSPKYPIEVGASAIKDFDKALVGRVPGDVVDVDLKFPRDYADAEMAGKPGSFTVKVVKVQERIIPELNDELLKRAGNFKDEKALREQVEKDLEQQEKERAKNEAVNKAIDTLIKHNDFEVPPARIEHYIDYMLEEVKKYGRKGETPPTREDIDKRYRESAVRLFKRYRIIDFVAGKENIKATQEEVDAHIRTVAERYQQDWETVKAAWRKDGTTNRIRDDIREQKVLDFLVGEYVKPQEVKADA